MRFPSKSALLFAFLASLARVALAGSFNTVRFVQPERWALGLEPEVTLTSGAGVGFNARFTYGVSDLSNLQAVLGTGTGPKQFRVGGVMTFDFFPDIQGQPGIGLAPQALFYTTAVSSGVEVAGVPYVHKTLVAGSNEIEPFLTLPVGLNLSAGAYQVFARMQVGAIFKMTKVLRATLEVGVGLTNSDSAASGGITYYY